MQAMYGLLPVAEEDGINWRMSFPLSHTLRQKAWQGRRNDAHTHTHHYPSSVLSGALTPFMRPRVKLKRPKGAGLSILAAALSQDTLIESAMTAFPRVAVALPNRRTQGCFDRHPHQACCGHMHDARRRRKLQATAAAMCLDKRRRHRIPVRCPCTSAQAPPCTSSCCRPTSANARGRAHRGKWRRRWVGEPRS